VSRVAYFSMEIALAPEIPTYAGGLGVLAGDTVRSFADLSVDALAVSLIHRKGYFRQVLDPEGQQQELHEDWSPERLLEPLAPRVEIEIEARRVFVRAWCYRVRGQNGHTVPVYLLDTDLPENAEPDRSITDQLYGGDPRYRLCQEAVLGLAGVRMLRALGHDRIDRFHLNEGHAALAVLELLAEEQLAPPQDGAELIACVERVRGCCVFTTHTPVPAGHDVFPEQLAGSVLGASRLPWLAALGQRFSLNMTDLALRTSHFVNGVAMRHGEVSQGMFPNYPIRSITNGVHAATWASPPFCELFDRHIPDWRSDAFSLRYAVGIPVAEIEAAHRLAKADLIARVRAASGVELDTEVLTFGFARRATPYKRAALVFEDAARLQEISERLGPMQFVFAGKAHPHDAAGQEIIRRLFGVGRALEGRLRVVYLPDYDMDLGRRLCAGVDVWLNTPVPPQEASGTSGMKAALNGVPSLSILDGWWVEGCVEGVTGWAIGDDGESEFASDAERDTQQARALYEKLADAVLPCFYERPRDFAQMMRHSIALNGSFFNTQRMVLQYLYEAYGSNPRERAGRL
jgi:glycogen phosphorylase